MTQEVYGGSWKDDVIAIAVENGDVELSQSGKETLAVRVVYGGSMGAQRKDNANFTFAVEPTPTATAKGTTVGAHDGIISASTTGGTCIISVTLDDAPQVEPAYVKVTVT